jgi:hypothetical protein
VNIYQGAEVVGVIDPAVGTPGTGYFAVEPNNVAWNSGDVVIDTNAVPGTYSINFFNSYINNPYSNRALYDLNWFGLGGSVSVDGHDGYFELTTDTTTVDSGVTSPYYAHLHGPFSAGLIFDYQPLNTHGQPNNNCDSFLICVRNGPYNSSQSTVMGIYSAGDVAGGQFSFDHANNKFIFGTDIAAGLNSKFGGEAPCLQNGNGCISIYPAVEPTGICTTNGQWSYSYDGHTALCSSGTWINVWGVAPTAITSTIPM